MTNRLGQLLLFQKLRRWLFRNNLHVLVHQSPVRLITIIISSLLIWFGVFGASLAGFHFLQSERIPFAGNIIGTLFDFLFLSLAVMLVFSTGIILYSSLFTSTEAAFLLSTPAAADHVFSYKYQGAVAFSSWAFLLLGFPVLLAYGFIFGVPWYFYALLPLYFIGFVLLPGSLGALGCMLVVCFVPRQRNHVLVTLGLLVVACIGYGMWRVNHVLREDTLNPDLLRQLYGQIGFAQGPVVPSHWMTRGLQAAAKGNFGEAVYRLALLWSNGLFFYLLTAFAASKLYRRGYDRVAAGGSQKRRAGGAWMDRTLSALVGFLHPQTRLLIVKDFRTFRRDPAQWAQIAIFCSLLTLYFVNTRRFFQQDISRAYQNGISLLNLISIALLMCAYTGRFIYPLLSLEGRKFWILGLLPMKRDRLLWGKFAFSTLGSLLIAEFLMLVGDVSMGLPQLALNMHLLTVAVLSLGLSGLSVGLGAWMPNFRESDPSKIAVGFGGTLNLVACLLFLLLVIGLMAAPWHARVALEAEVEPAAIALDGWMAVGLGAGLLVGACAVAVPLRLGSRTLRRMEF